MKQFIMILAGVMLLASSAFGEPGNVDSIGGVDLKDVIMSLQVSAGLSPLGASTGGDANSNGKIGLEEAIYGLQIVAGLRESAAATTWYKDADGDKYSDNTQIISAARPSGGYYKESELLAIAGDPNDNDPQAVPVGAITEIARIQTSIQTTGAGWVAETNPVSVLSDDQRKLRLGAILPASIPQSAKRTYTARDNPPYFDWRNNNGNFVTPVKDQGGCGSCWAFSTAAALESQILMRTGQSRDLSEQIVLSCSGAGSCNGGYPTSASDFLRNTGTNTESCYSYTETNGNCANACSNWQSSASRIDSWSYVNNTVANMKNAIYANGPLVTTMAVYTDFFSYRSGVYRYTWGQLEGYHAIVVVGWDDASSSFIVKNSWNTWWGDSGYYRIAYSEVTGNSKFGYLTIAYTTNASCTYTINPISNSFASSGGSGSISVTSGCAWTAANNAPSWITITSGASGNGNGTVGYSVSAYTGTGSRTGTITIGDKVFTITQTAPQIIQFSSSAYNVGEADGSALITVTRTGNTSEIVSVNYTTGNGTAATGSDYTSTSGNVVFLVGETAKTFTVGIVNDSVTEGNETVNLTLTNSSSGAVLSTAVLTIADDDIPQRGQLQFNSASYSVNESGSSVTITVTRTGGSNGAVGVSYSVGGGTAAVGQDYSAASGTITFADGDTADKTFSVPILNDSLVEGNETANLTLSNPTGGAALGSTSSAVLTIADDDSPPTVDLFLQNETVTTTLTYTTSNSIWAGYEVTTQKPYGDYVIQSGGNVTLNSKTIYLKPGFKASSGSTFKATAQ